MKLLYSALFFILLLTSPNVLHAKELPYRDGEVLVKYKKIDQAPAMEKRRNLKMLDSIDGYDVRLLKSDRQNTQELIKELRDDSAVELVEPNYMRTPHYTPNDAIFSSQWALHNTGQAVSGTSGTNDADIDAREAWDSKSATATQTIVAVIDSGVEYTHTDLSNNMWDGSTCFDKNNTPIAGGCPNHGWDYANNDNNPVDQDLPSTTDNERGHGTFAAGIIGAHSGNDTGISGISRHNKVKIMALRFDFDIFSEIDAIAFAKNNGAKVINASFGGPGYSQIERNAIESFGGIFVTAAGNGGDDDIGDDMDSAPEYPCAFTSTNLICVGASDQNDQLASFSNYGLISVDLAAPGVNVASTYHSNGYAIGDGTSFSTPYVAGAAALLYSAKPSASVNTVKNTLLYSSDKKSTLTARVACTRRLNLRSALQNIQANIIPAEACSSPKPLYRFFHKQKGVHFYTISTTERDDLIANQSQSWHYAGPKFYAYESQIAGTKPLYRFFHKQKGVHFYTISTKERDDLIANQSQSWHYAGPKFYAYESQIAGTKPLYRFFHKQKGVHFYTISTAERDDLIANQSQSWHYAGPKFYAYE